MIRLFINSHQVELYENLPIGYTKQVNSLKDLASRQANFTKNFRVPGTPKNKSFFEGLGITGSTSRLPYQRNTARLFLGNLCLIFTGWAVFDETGNDYSLTLYDGNIDFFKLLDNSKFEDISLPELSHIKDVNTIKDNWENGNDFFKYLTADFNGETHFVHSGTEYINTDYLIPSVPVKYLWDRIFEKFGFTYAGSIFQEEEFNNLFLTYPKGVTSGEVAEPIFSINYPKSFIWGSTDVPTWLLGGYWDWEYEPSDAILISNQYRQDRKAFQVPEDGIYRIATTGTLYARAKKGHASFFYYAINLHTFPLEQITTDQLNVIAGGHGEIDLENEKTVELLAGDTITFFYDKERARQVNYDESEIQFNAQISKINQTSIDQIGFFKNLTPKDFYREIMWRFGLTPFPKKDQNHIDFLTWEERASGTLLDWSHRFNKKISERYVYDGYAQKNYFRFKYNGEGDEFNDGSILIDNQNLEEKADVIESKTYSVERLPVAFNIGLLPEDLPKIELWEKEVKTEGGETVIEYKPRDSRFSFVREREIEKTVSLGSKELAQYTTASRIKVIERHNYSWQKLIDERYRPVKSLFKNTLIIKAEFQFSEVEFDTYDLQPVVYVEQLGGIFLVNTISKQDLFQKKTQVELIKINL